MLWTTLPYSINDDIGDTVRDTGLGVKERIAQGYNQILDGIRLYNHGDVPLFIYLSASDQYAVFEDSCRIIVMTIVGSTD